MTQSAQQKLVISSDFDGGNIECISADTPASIRLNIRADNQSDFYQWFYYRLDGATGQACVMSIENAHGAAFVNGWDGYQACASYDDENWFRVPASYAKGQLKITHTPEHDTVFYAYFAPYTMARHQAFIEKLSASPLTQMSVIGQTLDGRDLDLVRISNQNRMLKKQIWVTARQHPGETMAEWWMEGFLARLLDEDDAVARSLRDLCDFHIVPNMNPDGSARGHLRTNACGANLNREWTVATAERSPEVLAVMNEMRETGVDFCLDVHGDEALPYNFIAAAEGVEKFDDVHAARLEKFLSAYKAATPEFQTKVGYPVTPRGKGNLTMCTNYVAQEYDCLSMTLEMPFKDNADLPDPKNGWSTARSAKLGHDVLPAIFEVLGDL